MKKKRGPEKRFFFNARGKQGEGKMRRSKRRGRVATGNNQNEHIGNSKKSGGEKFRENGKKLKN